MMTQDCITEIGVGERIALTKMHLLCATLFGLGLTLGLGALGYATESRLIVAMAAISTVAGYLSQFAASNWMWSGNDLWHGVMTGFLLTAGLAWLIGVVAYFA